MEQKGPLYLQEQSMPEWDLTLARTIFYLTVALSLWFYWFAGINCPC